MDRRAFLAGLLCAPVLAPVIIAAAKTQPQVRWFTISLPATWDEGTVTFYPVWTATRGSLSEQRLELGLARLLLDHLQLLGVVKAPSVARHGRLSRLTTGSGRPSLPQFLERPVTGKVFPDSGNKFPARAAA